ncbi:MAG: tetratricopeptide repeat protein, partial [Wolinella sp.]
MKENISYIKEEIGQEERMLEGMIRFEGWFRKYKKAVFAFLAVILAFWIGVAGYEWYQESRAQKAYAIYEQLLKNPDNMELLEKLKQSGSGLYELFLFHEASQKSDEAALATLLDSQNEIIASLA